MFPSIACLKCYLCDVPDSELKTCTEENRFGWRTCPNEDDKCIKLEVEDDSGTFSKRIRECDYCESAHVEHYLKSFKVFAPVSCRECDEDFCVATLNTAVSTRRIRLKSLFVIILTVIT